MKDIPTAHLDPDHYIHPSNALQRECDGASQNPTPQTDALEQSLTTWTIVELDRAMAYARKLEQERDSYREKAEALDWLENNKQRIKMDFIYNGNRLTVVYISLYRDGIWYQHYFRTSLLSAIQQVMKEEKK
jgi:hypothetical protein